MNGSPLNRDYRRSGSQDNLLNEKKWTKKSLAIIFITWTIYCTVDIVLNTFSLNGAKLNHSELIKILVLLFVRAVAFGFYLKLEHRTETVGFKIFEFLFVCLFCVTSVFTWNAEINMSVQRGFIAGLDAAWVLRYMIILLEHWKFKVLFEVGVVIFGIVKLSLMYDGFSMAYVQAGLQIVYFSVLLFSREQVQQINYTRTLSLKETKETLSNILNNIPENIAVINLNGVLSYSNDYMNICFKIREEDDEVETFSKFYSIRPRERYFNLDSNTETEHYAKFVPRKAMPRMPGRGLTLTKEAFSPNHHLKEEHDFNNQKGNLLNDANIDGLLGTLRSSRNRNLRDSHASITEVMSTIDQFNSLQEVIDFFVANLTTLRSYSDKQNNFFIFDCKYRENPSLPSKSFEIKISLASFEGDESLILILRDTTHRDIIATLETNNTFKNSVLRSISHELRTPLNANLNLLDIAIKDEHISQVLKENYLVPAHQSGKLLHSLIKDVLDYSLFLAHKFTLSCKTKDINETLSKITYLFESQAKNKGLAFELNFEYGTEQKIRTDHRRLRQILTNLLSNALKFTSVGKITVTIEPWGMDSRVAKFSVTDTGCGMTDKTIEKVRRMLKKNEFLKSEEPTEGIGMGLMMSNMLARKLCPNVTKLSGLQFESTIEEGSTFWFYVDIKRDSTVPASPTSVNNNNSGHRNLLVLSRPFGESSTSQIVTEQKEDDWQSLNTENSHVKFVETRYKLSRLATIERRKTLTKMHEFNIEVSDKEATLGDDDQAEDEAACMVKDINIMKNNTEVDVSSKLENSLMPRPKFMTNNSTKLTKKISNQNKALSARKYSKPIELPSFEDVSCGCPKILVADDDTFNLFTMQSIMRTFGLTITKATNGLEAVNAVKKRYNEKCSATCRMFQLVFMDLSMPVMDGFEATCKLRELMENKEVPYIPIVACTAFVDTDNMEKCLECGMEGRITKPVSKHKIQELLKELHILYTSDSRNGLQQILDKNAFYTEVDTGESKSRLSPDKMQSLIIHPRSKKLVFYDRSYEMYNPDIGYLNLRNRKQKLLKLSSENNKKLIPEVDIASNSKLFECMEERTLINNMKFSERVSNMIKEKLERRAMSPRKSNNESPNLSPTKQLKRLLEPIRPQAPPKEHNMHKKSSKSLIKSYIDTSSPQHLDASNEIAKELSFSRRRMMNELSRKGSLGKKTPDSALNSTFNPIAKRNQSYDAGRSPQKSTQNKSVVVNRGKKEEVINVEDFKKATTNSPTRLTKIKEVKKSYQEFRQAVSRIMNNGPQNSLAVQRLFFESFLRKNQRESSILVDNEENKK